MEKTTFRRDMNNSDKQMQMVSNRVRDGDECDDHGRCSTRASDAGGGSILSKISTGNR
ncbi:MAG: hypothetical protein Fues2KO_49520 [Fuerstiella sp.]